VQKEAAGGEPASGTCVWAGTTFLRTTSCDAAQYVFYFLFFPVGFCLSCMATAFLVFI
jgi:hypothetical protein